MNNLTNDCIAIDTNVFEHLLNPQNNTENHIDTLLSRLQQDQIPLIVDNKNRITGEYRNRIQKIIQKSFETDYRKSYLLRYWIEQSKKIKVDVDFKDILMVQIAKIIIKRPDNIFVYVAFKLKRILISNDENHIINNRSNLRSIERNSQLLTSKEAESKL